MGQGVQNVDRGVWMSPKLWKDWARFVAERTRVRRPHYVEIL
jgi:hypothetical protein